MRSRIDGKVVLITGPARGIGAETARRLAAKGARLALVGLEPERLEALARELGQGHAWFECDVTDQRALERAVEGTVASLGGIDVVVANAGIAGFGTVASAPVEALVRTVEVNLSGVIRTVHATLPHVERRRGYYLLVSSASAFAPVPGIATYGATKIGVQHFGTSLRIELAHRGVGVGVVHPSWIDTDLVRDPRHDLRSFEAMLRRLPGPFGAVTSVEECAAAFVDAIERRRRLVYVPKSVRPLAALRQLITSRLADWVLVRDTKALLAQMERESGSLGRAFGRNSVEAIRAADERG